jgi:uncharacterized membrane protein YciS (DUF1049 family)
MVLAQAEIFGGALFIFVILGLIVGILWIVMPLVVFRIKDQLNRIMKELKETNAQLKALNATSPEQKKAD